MAVRLPPRPAGTSPPPPSEIARTPPLRPSSSSYRCFPAFTRWGYIYPARPGRPHPRAPRSSPSPPASLRPRAPRGEKPGPAACSGPRLAPPLSRAAPLRPPASELGRKRTRPLERKAAGWWVAGESISRAEVRWVCVHVPLP